MNNLLDCYTIEKRKARIIRLRVRCVDYCFDVVDSGC